MENRFTTVIQCLETHSFVHICLQKTEFVGFRDKKKECKYENKILVPYKKKSFIWNVDFQTSFSIEFWFWLIIILFKIDISP